MEVECKGRPLAIARSGCAAKSDFHSDRLITIDTFYHGPLGESAPADVRERFVAIIKRNLPVLVSLGRPDLVRQI